ncbi:ABC transporter ATP-binding protein [Cohnella cellulosilytica]|uniref:ABC transporter ATP-binding protein n=1 Tax=Cohnella cellulosilytica TaxID=986710 RepID=A0ABW2FBN4_9BACL
MQSYRLFRRIRPYIELRRPLAAVGYLCALLAVVCSLVQPVLFSYLIDRVLIAGERSRIVPLLTLSMGLAVGYFAASLARAGIFRYLGVRHTLDLRERTLAHLRRIPLSEIERHGPGKYSALLGWDTAALGNFVNHVVVELVIQCFTIAGAVCMIFYMDYRMGVAALGCIAAIVFIPRLFQKPLARYAGQLRAHNEEIGTFLYETIQGSREIRAFGLEQWEARRNDKLYRHLISYSTRETLYRALSGQTGVFAVSAIIVFLYGFGSGQVLSGALSVGLLVAAVQYFYNLLQPLMTMNNLFGDLKQAEVSMERIELFMRIPPEPAALDGPRPEATCGEDAPYIGASGLRVSVDGVELIRGIDFAVRRGQTAAFVGRSGAGKTTLLKTICGLWPVADGRLHLEGRPHEQWTRADLTGKVGFVFQDAFLFAGTLLENIAIGNLSAEENEVYEAACQAGLRELIDGLPQGLHTRLDNQGFLLSGGQRQRVSIARAILKRPDILILDEPTSALDRETEAYVLNALRRLMEGKTTLVSTHKIETIRSADVICVMDGGRIVDSGTYEQLAKQCQLFRDVLAEARSARDPSRSTA